MPVKIDFDRFRFEKAVYAGPSDEWEKRSRVGRSGVSRDACDFMSIGNDIVRELQRVGWDVPFVDVEIDHYGSGKNVIRACRQVSFPVEYPDGERTVTIRYGLKSGQKGGYNLCGSAGSYTMTKSGEYEAGFKGALYDDGSGDWTADKWSPVLPEMWHVLKQLKALPAKPGHDVLHVEGDLNLRQLCKSEPKPVHENMPEKLYVWIKADDLYHAYNDPYLHREGDYAAEKDYVLAGTDYRMVPEMRLGDYMVPYAAWRGGNYASEVNAPVKRGLEFSAEYEGLPVEIALKDLNDVYVYDYADYRRGRAEASRHADETGENDWKPGEFEAIKMKAMVTFVEAADYRGGYEEPVFMIARQLHKDEARAMKGPIHARVVEGGAETVMKDEVTGEEILLHEVHPDSFYGPVGHMQQAVREANKAGRITGATVEIDPEIPAAIEAHHDAVRRCCGREEHKDDEIIQFLGPRPSRA
jgi:hypothetical protein